MLAVRESDGAPWIYNPHATQKLAKGMTLVVLGDPTQVRSMREALA